MSETERAEALNRARQAGWKETEPYVPNNKPSKGIKNGGNGIYTSEKNIKDLTAAATPMGMIALLKQVRFLADMPFAAALGVAMLKDLVDLATWGTVVLPFVFSALCSIFIFMMLLLVGASRKRKGASNMLKMIGVLAAGGIVDSIPGLNILPIETITVFAIYVLVLIERKNTQEEEEKKRKKAEEEKNEDEDEDEDEDGNVNGYYE